MSLLAADEVVLTVGEGASVAAITGIRRRKLVLSRRPGERTPAMSDGWSRHETHGRAGHADISVEGVLVADAAASALRSQFLSGEAGRFALELPRDGVWSGDFFIRQLTFDGKAEGEMQFALRIVSSGPVTFTAAGS